MAHSIGKAKTLVSIYFRRKDLHGPTVLLYHQVSRLLMSTALYLLVLFSGLNT